MPITIPTTIPEDKVPSPKRQVKYRLVKMPLDNRDSSKGQDKSHTQLFLNMTDKTESSKGTPSYYREVCRADNKINHLYWYDAALKTYSGSTTLWSIDEVKPSKSTLRRINRPREFSITNKELGSNSVFKRSGGGNKSKGYSGEVVTPYDHSCIQRYQWVRYKDGSGWAFIFRNDPTKPLVEMRKTSSRNEFEIVFLQNSPPGWSSGTKQNSKTFNPFNHPTRSGRHPPSTHQTSDTSKSSDPSNTQSVEEHSHSLHASNKQSHKYLVSCIYSNRAFATVDSERYWQEFVLASTVAVQDEVNSSKKRLWKN